MKKTVAMFSVFSLFFSASAEIGDRVSFSPTDINTYRVNASKGNQDAMYSIGSCSMKGLGVKKDLRTGIPWMKKAAKAGFAPAMHRLVECNEKGEGVAVDKDEAIEWYSKAAVQGLERSFKALKRLVPQEISKDEI